MMTEATEADASMEDVVDLRGIPAVDMQYGDESEAYEFYNKYAEHLGFLVRKSKLWVTSKNIVTRRTFVCSREGFREQKKGAKEVRNPRPETRSGCPACMTIKITPSGRYRVTEFVPNHNHQLASPSTIHVLRSKRVKTKARAAKPDMTDDPVIATEFENEDEAHEFYNRYAGSIGFNVRKSSMWTTSKNVITRRTFVCSREGFRERKKGARPVRKPRPTTRTGCPACMTIKITPSGRYHVTEFVTNHNHQLAIGSNGEETMAQGDEEDMADDSMMALEATCDAGSLQVAGCRNLSFLSVDYKNYLRSKRLKAMQMADAGAVLEYLQKMQVESPSFFYAIQVDENDIMANFFWVDAKSVMDYNHFGDVVCFDTSYQTNDYGRPFAPFLGINHHKQTVIFGAALLYDETMESFKWLFETLKVAMGGKQPKTILTDQCATLSDAIAAVWPGTSHRLCVWHVYQNAAKHLNLVFQGSKTFANDFSRCIFDYEEEEEFISEWKAMLEVYDLKDNQWLAKLFEDRDKWALAYGRQTFCADIKSALQRENLNSMLKKYLSPERDFLQFFEHYERLLDERRYEELQADCHSYQSTVRIPPLRMLRQAANAYTPAAFKMFQREFDMYVDCMVYSCGEVEAISEYKVTVEEKPKGHFVRFNSSNGTISCSCKKFEFVGIQCRHVLKVLDSRNIKELPAQYILKRWRKDAKDGTIRDNDGLEVAPDPESYVEKRYYYLCRIANIISTRAAKTIDAYTFTECQSDQLMEQVEKILQRWPLENPSLSIASTDQPLNLVESVVVESLHNDNTNEVTPIVSATNGFLGFRSTSTANPWQRAVKPGLLSCQHVPPTICWEQFPAGPPEQ